MRKQPEQSCTICGSLESLASLVRAMQAIVNGSGPPTAAEVRRERRRYIREMLAHRPIPDATDRRRWIEFVLEGHPELRAPAGRPWVPISGLVLYVLAAMVAQILEHTAELSWDKLAAHLPEGRLLGEIVTLGAGAERDRRRTRSDLGREGLEIRVVARLLGLEEKLVRLRLGPADLRAELAAARKRGAIEWVSWGQVQQAALYRRDTAMVRELYQRREVSDAVARVTRTRSDLVELINVIHPSRPRFVQVPVADLARSPRAHPRG